MYFGNEILTIRSGIRPLLPCGSLKLKWAHKSNDLALLLLAGSHLIILLAGDWNNVLFSSFFKTESLVPYLTKLIFNH
ncbi:hypothetical protein LCGC14_0501380 [marine sediment metagenome]|uniref:Uncharacterized protein n=1 Tax=marine sediment metagenome TaxID=412755 RepID=A0A0F9SM89_9ZZZZ